MRAVEIEIVDSNDVLVPEALGTYGFALQCHQRIGVALERLAQYLQGDVGLAILKGDAIGIERFENCSHAAPSELFNQGVSTVEDVARSERA
jgi:hypothetical protein